MCWSLFFFFPPPLLPWQLLAREIGLVCEYLVKMKYILVSGGEFFFFFFLLLFSGFALRIVGVEDEY